MENLNKTPTTGTFGEVAKVLDTNFGLVVAKLIELEQSNRGSNVGFYATETALKNAYPSPTLGLMAFVGTGNSYTVYRCSTTGTWAKTSETFSIDSTIDLTNYVKTDTFNTLQTLVNNLATGAVYMGAATTTTTPNTSAKVMYLATAAGTYTNFGGLSVKDNEIALLFYNGSSWTKNSVDLSANISEIRTMAEMALEKASQGVLFVSIDALDTVLGSTPNEVLKALQKSNGKTMKYLVYYNDYIVGYIDMFGDSMLHCMNQEFTTNYLINDDGTITSASAHNHKLHKYVRYYNIRWSSATDWRGEKWAIGTWTKWNSPTEDIESSIATLQTADTTLQTNIDNEVAARKSADDTLQGNITAIKNSVGKASGIAPLNEDGKVSSDYLPSESKKVLSFGGIVSGMTIQAQSVIAWDEIDYDSERNTFLAMKDTKYYSNWTTRGDYCAEAEGEPYTEKIYTDGVSTYYYDGEALVCIGADNTEAVANLTSSLNTEVSNRQSEDTKLKTDISNEAIERKKNDATLQASITAINGKFLNMTESEYAALSTYDDSTYYMLTEE